jgi:hypothetical protein
MSEFKIDGRSDEPLAKPTSDYPAPYSPPSALSGVHGEFGAEGQPRLPLLRIIQNVGTSSVKHPQDRGGLLYHKDTIVPRPASVSFYGLHGYYVQNLLFDPNVQPQRFETIAEVEAAGGNCASYVKPGVDENNYVPAGIAFLIVRAPNGLKSWAKDCSEVSVTYEEKKQKELLLPAMWYLRGTTYRIVAPLLQRLFKDSEREGKKLVHAKYSLDTQQALVGANYVYVPMLKRAPEDNSNQFADFAKDIFGE